MATGLALAAAASAALCYDEIRNKYQPSLTTNATIRSVTHYGGEWTPCGYFVETDSLTLDFLESEWDTTIHVNDRATLSWKTQYALFGKPAYDGVSATRRSASGTTAHF